jgi:tetratricopeptide (TPR) repeat protein
VIKLGKNLASLLLITLIWSGCSDNPGLQLRYQAEQMFYRAENAARQARIRPELMTAEVSGRLRGRFDSTLTFCYRAIDSLSPDEYPVEHRELTEIAFRSATRLSQICYLEERYDRCVEILDNLLHRVHLSGLPQISTHLNLGRVLQTAGHWDSALTTFNYAVDNFYPPINDQGEIIINLFGLPNHIYDIFIRVHDSASAAVQVGRAEAYYRRLIADYPNSTLSGAGHLSLTGLYERLGRWADAVAELSKVTDATGILAPSARMRVASLHAGQLGRPDLAIDEYDRILAGLTGRDTLRRPIVLYNKGLVQMHQKEYALARQTLVDVKRRYKNFFARMPVVQFAIARSFEFQDNWERAETEYKFLINNFPTSEQSLSTYLFLVDKYTEQKRVIEAERMEQRAEAQYLDLAATMPDSRVEAAALSYLAELARRRSDWPQAVELLSDVFDRFPTSEFGFRAAVTAAMIYSENLGDDPAADSLIQELKKKLTTVDETANF